MARVVQILSVLLLLLEFTEQVPDVFVEVEDDAILTCDRVQDRQNKCDRTAWFYDNPLNTHPTIEIVKLGQITPRYRNNSDRYSVTENCSLVIKKVHIEYAGRYSCQQFDQSGQEVADAPVLLSVVSLIEHKDPSEVRLNCYVSSPQRCITLSVKLIYNNTEFTADDPSIRKSEYLCGATFSVLPSFYFSALRRELFTCEVSHKNKKHQFKLRPEQTEQVPDVFVKEEDDVILTCDKVQDRQNKCDRTTWLYSNPLNTNPAIEIISLGQITPRYKYKSDRLSVTENCSLVFKKVQIQEYGRYSCQQFDQSGQQVADAPVLLSVVSLTEHKDPSEVKLNCYVSSPQHCITLSVKWIYNNTEFTADHSSIRKTVYPCGDTFSVPPSFYFSALRRELFTCEVSHENKKHQFKLRPEQTEETTTKNTGETGATSSSLPVWWWWPVLVAVAVAAVMITAVVLYRRRNNRMKPREALSPEPAVSLTSQTESEEAVSYASVTYTKKNKARAEPRASEDDSVTYSSVRTPAPEDHSQLYASVCKQ